MMRSYQKLWPEHPFVFRVPFQEYPQKLADQHSDRIELIKTPPDISNTVLTLISDLDDDEWVYWCLDDKYPVDLDTQVIIQFYNFVKNCQDESIRGVLFCRCRMLMDETNLRMATLAPGPAGLEWIERKNYYQFWIHQFMRVSVLRSLFKSFPDRNYSAKEMDTFTGQEENQLVKEFDAQQKMYVSLNNYARFGESTHRGYLLDNCYHSMLDNGIEPPEEMKRISHSILMGEMNVSLQ